MAKIKDRAKPSLPPVAPGTYTAICVHSLDIGEQLSEFKGTKRYTNQVILTFELCGEFIEVDGQQQPRTLSRTFTFSKSEKSGLRKFVESWRGQKFATEEFSEFDTNDLVGRECMVGVILNDTGEYANIDTIMGLPKGMQVSAPASPLIRWDMDPWNQEAFDKLPEWAQDRIKKSTDYQKQHPSTDAIQPTSAATQPKQEVPF